MTRARVPAFVAMVIVGALLVAVAVRTLSTPADDFAAGQAGDEVIIAVAEGDSLAVIGKALVSEGVVKTMTAFLRAVDQNPQSRLIQPGGYRVQRQIPAATAIEQLLDRQRRTGVVTLFEGIRASQVVERLASLGLTRDELNAAFTNTSAPMPKAYSLEGFLFPGQYAFLPSTTSQQAVDAMLARFTKYVEANDFTTACQKLGLSPYQGLIVASLLQAEGHPEDYAKILRVILNRLKIGMALQLDATVLYALNRFGDVRVSSKDLQINSPYNTYRHRGLPPTPINNPGSEALDALQSPADGDWLYYITVKPHDTRFTRSFEQFLDWKAEFRKNYRDGLFK